MLDSRPLPAAAILLLLLALPASARDAPLPALDPAEALATAESFLAAPTLEEKLSHVRDRERVAPFVRAFYEGRDPGALEQPAHDPPRPMASVEIGGLITHPFQVSFHDGTNRLLTVIPAPDGPRVDWESYARHNPVPWTTFLAGNHIGPAPFRVFLQLDDYYNYQFSGRNEFTCYRLTTPDLDHYLYGYVERASELDRRLRLLLLGDPRRRNLPQRAILELADDEAGSIAHSQVRITALLETGWVALAPATSAETPR